jgi:hypothetical protein
MKCMSKKSNKEGGGKTFPILNFNIYYFLELQ